MEVVKAYISLSDLGITGGLRTKRAMTGTLILQIPGQGSVTLGDKLAERLREVFSATDAFIRVRVRRETPSSPSPKLRL